MTAQAIDRKTGTSLYYQISQILENEICNQCEIGDYLPAENELAERFNVNRHTVRHAIDKLVEKGLLERHHGKGNYVIEKALDYPINQGTRFTETLSTLGKSTDTCLLQRYIIPAQGGVANKLQLDSGARIMVLESLRKVDNKPFCIVSHFIPLENNEVIYTGYSKGSLHQFISDNLGLSLKRNKSLVTSALPQGDDYIHLKIPRNMPILRVKSVNTDCATDTPFEYALTRFRADRVQLSLDM